ncbi:hypothetical protein [Herbaspirillum sp.]|uniref:hypothetical protein n=2 Tax=unclassified Herbaspirillum TaxID=2624150 RepID=UPI0025807475|nr:hypothetical protein [Herbaspirillum sp.]
MLVLQEIQLLSDFVMVNLVKDSKMSFDPIKSRTNGFNDEMLNFYLGTQYDENRPMGNVAVSEIGTVVKAWLLGLHNEVSPIIHRSNEWLDRAIKEDEKFGPDPNAHRTTLHWARAIGGWLEDGWNYEGEWDAARIFEEARWRYEQRPWSTHEIVKSGLDDYMAFAYQGGEYDDGFEAGIEMYERWTGKTGVTLSKTLKPRDFGYALCLHRTARQSFDEKDLFKAGCKMLQANLQDTWLGGGQFIRAATWLKIVHWHNDETLTPLQTILKAYDNMPKVPRPDFVRAI